MKTEFGINRKFVVNLVISIFFIFIIYAFIKLISPFIISLFLSLVFTVVFYPVYIFFKKKISFNDNIAAFMSVLCLFFIFVIPLLIFGWLLFKEARLIYPSLVEYYSSFNFNKIKIPDFLPFSAHDIKEIIIANIDELRGTIIKSGGVFVKNIFFFFVNLFVMFISMFFFFRDGKKILSYLIEIIPFSNQSIERILNQFENSVNSIIRGIVITAFIQGVIAMLGFYISGLSSPVLLGAMVMFSALIPFLGTATVTIPIIIYCYFTKPFPIAIFLLFWNIFIVGLVDNLIRPILIGNYSKLPIGLVFLGIVGGIKSFGPVGIFIGPIFIALFITILDIYMREKV